MLTNETNLGVFVSNLESVERWCEVGTPAIIDDFTAVKDLIDMTHDIVPGSFVSGLPEGSGMPGLVADPGLYNDIFYRCYISKDIHTAGTDRWLAFPIASEDLFGGRLPVCGVSTPTIYEFMNLGAPKFLLFNASANTRAADVDSIIRVPGTDFWHRNYLDITGIELRDIFGVVTNKEGAYCHDASLITFYDAYDQNGAANLRDQLVEDSLRNRHPWKPSVVWDRASYPTGFLRILDESKYDYIAWQDAEDLGCHLAEFYGKALGIPYIKSGS
jgi:hypothetical protein